MISYLKGGMGGGAENLTISMIVQSIGASIVHFVIKAPKLVQMIISM